LRPTVKWITVIIVTKIFWREIRVAKGRPREFDMEQALDAAMFLFWRHGYEGTSMSALAEAMGINMPSVYAAFGDKPSLFAKALDRYLQRPASYLPNALKAPTAREATERLFAGAVNMVMHPSHPDGCLLVQGALASGPDVDSIKQRLSQGRASAENAVRLRFQRAIEEGDLTPDADPARLARYVITIVWGMSVQAAGGATRSQLKDIAKMALQSWPQSSPQGNSPLKNRRAVSSAV
jgi:AcrR family transcriptional regulator